MDGPRPGPDQREGAVERIDPRDHLGYAKTLGIHPDALREMSQDEAEAMVKSNFRLALKRTHADRHPDDPNADEKTKAIFRANEILSDPALRSQYLNRTGSYAKPPGRIFYGKR
ncbi:MAG: DnaJ domain-containing protein [Candidatus Curtissbacteria bacterium]|nr:DnaJ domain-containing protein [Candidatus Curtissbacteria bacterium]